MPMALLLRATFLESREQIAAPGQTFSSEEFANARAFSTLGEPQRCDAILFPQDADFFEFSGHDEVRSLASHSEETHVRRLDGLRDCGAADDGSYFK